MSARAKEWVVLPSPNQVATARLQSLFAAWQHPALLGLLSEMPQSCPCIFPLACIIIITHASGPLECGNWSNSGAFRK